MKTRTLVIAEAGVNHNGSLELAKKLVVEAQNAGADIIKFQSFKTEMLVTKNASQADYQRLNSGNCNNSQYNMLKSLELNHHQQKELMHFCIEHNIKFLSTAFDLDSIDFLHTLNIGLWKIPSGEITNFPYLKKIAEYNEPTILSTGMCNMDDIENAVFVLLSHGLCKDKLSILHCNTEYPTPMQDVNLKVMSTLKKKFGVKVGYSDHTQGIEIPIAAVALGACIIEKHFTLDRNLPGPDHKASLEPSELKAMVQAIRNVEKALGSTIKRVSPSEAKNINIARKSIVASRDIKKGEIFSEENLTTKRPGNGISPMQWDSVLGKKACKDFIADELITLG